VLQGGDRPLGRPLLYALVYAHAVFPALQIWNPVPPAELSSKIPALEGRKCLDDAHPSAQVSYRLLIEFSMTYLQNSPMTECRALWTRSKLGQDWRRRFWLSHLLTGPIFKLGNSLSERAAMRLPAGSAAESLNSFRLTDFA
jgi:hypothetical protein